MCVSREACNQDECVLYSALLCMCVCTPVAKHLLLLAPARVLLLLLPLLLISCRESERM